MLFRSKRPPLKILNSRNQCRSKKKNGRPGSPLLNQNSASLKGSFKLSMTGLVLWAKTYGVCFDHLCINFLFHTCQPLYMYNLFALNLSFLRSQERPCCERSRDSAQEYSDSSSTTILCSWASPLRSPERNRPAQQPQTLLDRKSVV